MYDRFNRKISYLRISVTDRCNLKCSYCMTNCDVKYMHHSEILTIEEIKNVVKCGISFGINKIRLTGGEPLLRNDLIDIVKEINLINGIKDLAITTNGLLLEKMADKLKRNGLNRINISLDTINEEVFKKITNGGDINKVLIGIKAAKKAGLDPVKINAVILNDYDKNLQNELKKFCKSENLELRFIRQMNLKKGEFYRVEGGDGGNCNICNRIRLTADGKMKPCLFSEKEFDIRKLGVFKAFELAVENKPLCGEKNMINTFYNIGG